MPSIKAIETLVEAAAESGAKLLPSIAEKAGLSAGSKVSGQLTRQLESGALKADILGPLQITDQAAALAARLSPEQSGILKANEVLVDHITKNMPQVVGGKLDWILGGSSATNALAASRSFSLLDTRRLPGIVKSRTIDMPEEAAASYARFARKVDDVDAFVVNGGKNRFLNSPYLGAAEVGLPEAATGALKAVGEARTSRLVQAVKMEFDHPEVAAIEFAGKTVFVTGPGQLMGNKMRQVLLSYSPAEAHKMTGDFSHLLDAAKSIYTEQQLMQFGRQALQRNHLLYKRDLSIPWDQSENNAKFLAFLRNVLESESKNGAYLKGLNIAPKDSITVMRLLEKHPAPQDKAAISGFISRHADAVAKMDMRGSTERALYLQQGGTGNAGQALLNILDRLPRSGIGGLKVSQRVQALDAQLMKGYDLPALSRSSVLK